MSLLLNHYPKAAQSKSADGVPKMNTESNRESAWASGGGDGSGRARQRVVINSGMEDAEYDGDSHEEEAHQDGSTGPRQGGTANADAGPRSGHDGFW